jgi:hypothetical protein
MAGAAIEIKGVGHANDDPATMDALLVHRTHVAAFYQLQ